MSALAEPAAQAVWRQEISDGRVALIRPARPDDRARFVAAVDGLSAQTRYQRFLSPIPRLAPRALDTLMDLDPAHQVVLHATDETGTAIVGVARLVFAGAAEAELAITVGDGWQRQGLGAALLDRLIACARDRGVRRLIAESLADNRAVAGLLRSRGFARVGPAGLTVGWVRSLDTPPTAPASPDRPGVENSSVPTASSTGGRLCPHSVEDSRGQPEFSTERR